MLLALAMFSPVIWSAVAPEDGRGNSLQTIDYAGAEPCVINKEIGVTAILCSSGAALTGPAILYGVISANIPLTDYLVFTDTNSSVAADTIKAATVAVVYNQIGASTFTAGTLGTNMFKFPVPIKFYNGINVHASVAPSGAATWTILWRKRASTD